MLKGQAKTDYQREYMRDWQRNRRGSKQQGLNTSVRPSDEYILKAIEYLDAAPVPTARVLDPNPSNIEYVDADGNPVYDD